MRVWEYESVGVLVEHFRELKVYKNSKSSAMGIFEVTRDFPDFEKFSLTDQIRRSSRSVCANIGEAWRKRRYKKAFVSKLSDSETEAGETQVWLDFALECHYIEKSTFDEMDQNYEEIIGQLVNMIKNADDWVIS